MIFPGSWSHNSEQEQRALPGKRHLVCHYEGGKNIGLKPGIVCLYRFIGTKVYLVTNGLLKIRMTSNAEALNMQKGEDEAMICVSMAFMALWQASIET